MIVVVLSLHCSKATKRCAFKQKSCEAKCLQRTTRVCIYLLSGYKNRSTHPEGPAAKLTTLIMAIVCCNLVNIHGVSW
jgi:hypothetical protein